MSDVPSHARMLPILRIGTALILVAPVSIAAATPHPDRFCAELSRTIEAVELGKVAALGRSGAQPPSFGFSHCTAQGRGWFCQQALAPPPLSLESLTASLLRCHPDIVRLPNDDSGYALFARGSVVLRVEESGARGAHVGRIVTFSIEPRP